MLTGFRRTCEGKKTAGIKKIGLISAKSITGITYDTSDTDAIKSVAMKASEVFAKFDFKEDECEFQENYSSENGVVVVEQKLIFKLETMSPETRAAVEEIAVASGCGILAAITKPAGKTLLVGWDKDFDGERPLRLESTTGTTGKALSDASGEEITLSRKTTVKAHYYVGEESALYAASE